MTFSAAFTNPVSPGQPAGESLTPMKALLLGLRTFSFNGEVEEVWNFLSF